MRARLGAGLVGLWLALVGLRGLLVASWWVRGSGRFVDMAGDPWVRGAIFCFFAISCGRVTVAVRNIALLVIWAHYGGGFSGWKPILLILVEIEVKNRR